MMMMRYAVLGFFLGLYGGVREHLETLDSAGDWALMLLVLVPGMLTVVWIETSARKEGYVRGVKTGRSLALVL